MNRKHIINDMIEIVASCLTDNWNPVHDLRVNESFLIFVQKGDGYVEQMDRCDILQHGDMIVISCDGTNDAIQIIPNQKLELFIIHFVKAAVGRYQGEWKVHDMRTNVSVHHFHMYNHPFIHYQLNQLREHFW